MKSIIFLLYLFLCFTAEAQTDSLKVAVSEIFNDEKHTTSLLFAKEDTNGDIFVVRNYYSSISSPKGYYIEHYDKNLKLLKKTTIAINRSEIKGLFLTEDSVVLLQFQHNYKEKKYAFVTLTSPKNDFNFKEKEIYSIHRNHLTKYERFGMRSEPEFNLHQQNNLGDIVESENGEFVALNLFTKTKKGDVLLVITFNKEFEKIYEYEFENIISLKETSNTALTLEYQNMVLDTYGTVYFLARVFNNTDKKLEKKDAPNYYFVLFKANKISKKQEIISVESDNIIRSLQLAIKEDNLASVGFYTKTTNTGLFDLSQGLDYDGIVHFKLDPVSLSTLSESFQPFSEEFILEKYGKLKENINTHLSYRNIFTLDKGDIIINAEEFEMPVLNEITFANRIYKDIITFRISKDGKLIWAKNINKKQNAWSLSNVPFLSYAATVKNDISYYFVNADSDLKELTNDRIKLNDGPKLYVLNVSGNGDLKYNIPLYSNIFNAKLEVRFEVLINDSDLLMQAESNKKPMLVKLYF